MAKRRNTYEIVKYHNSLNSVPFGVLTQREMNIFFAICSKLKVPENEKVSKEDCVDKKLGEQGEQKIILFSEMKKARKSL